METTDRKFRSPYHREAFEKAEARRQLVKREREKGRTWTDIAKDLEVTPQRCCQLGKK